MCVCVCMGGGVILPIAIRGKLQGLWVATAGWGAVRH